MAEALYLTDSYLKEFDAKVVKAEQGKIILDITAFYPESGGQPCDFGKLIRKSDNMEFNINNVKKESGEIAHYTTDGLKEGDEVKGIIDWDRRYKLMRMHTAAHILSAVINLQTNALITGNQLGIEKSRVDFDLDTLDRNALKDYFTAANEAVKWDLPVVVHFTTRDVLMNDKKLCKLLKGIPESVTEVRIVEVNIFDKQACAGTHVRRTSEIGNIVFIDAENRGASNKRAYFKLE
jgi:misacylated tRNA(Ala) deacylase